MTLIISSNHFKSPFMNGCHIKRENAVNVDNACCQKADFPRYWRETLIMLILLLSV